MSSIPRRARRPARRASSSTPSSAATTANASASGRTSPSSPKALCRIQQDGGVVAVATPFDKRLGEINDELAKKTLVFGDRRKQMEDKEKTGEALKLAPAAKADRAGFAGKDGKAAAYDLLDAIKNKEVVLSKLKTEELPEE